MIDRSLRAAVIKRWNAGGITVVELAAKMGRSKGTISGILFRARKNGIRVRSVSSSDAASRGAMTLRSKIGEAAFRAKMMHASRSRESYRSPP
jgi:hypothetical protein